MQVTNTDFYKAVLVQKEIEDRFGGTYNTLLAIYDGRVSREDYEKYKEADSILNQYAQA